MMMRISEHISLREATKSATAIKFGIDNRPSEFHLIRMMLVAQKIFEPVRSFFGDFPIPVTSFFRSIALNRKLRGAKKSQHTLGEAMDMDVDGMGYAFSNADIFHYIRNYLEFDKLIWEFGNDEDPDWVHVSYSDGKNRGIILRARKVKNTGWNRKIKPYKTVYEEWK